MWRVAARADGQRVYGDGAAAAVSDGIRQWHARIPGNHRFSRSAAAERAAAAARLKRQVVGAECARAARFAGQRDDAAWRRWELGVRAGRISPTDDAYFTAPIAPRDVALVKQRAARHKAPSPAYWVTSDVIIHGGRAVDVALALLFTEMLQSAWRLGFRRDIDKGKGGSRYSHVRSRNSAKFIREWP